MMIWIHILLVSISFSQSGVSFGVTLITVARTECMMHAKEPYHGCYTGEYCEKWDQRNLRCDSGCKPMERGICRVKWSARDCDHVKCLSCGRIELDDYNGYCDFGTSSGSIEGDPESGGCFSVDSIVQIMDNNVVQASPMNALDEFFTVQVYNGEQVDFQKAFVKVIDAKEGSKFQLLKLTTTSGKTVKSTPEHLFHFGDSCCSYKSLKPISDFREGDAIWVLGEDGIPVQDFVDSVSGPFRVSRVADVIPFDRVKPSPKEDGSCTWEATNFIIVNGFISTHHALDGYQEDVDQVTRDSIPIEDKLLAVDFLADDLMLGLKDLDVSSHFISEDSEMLFANFHEDLKGLILFCTTVEECDLEYLEQWFASHPLDADVSKWLDWKIKIEEATTYDLVFGSADRAAYFLKLTTHIRAAKEGKMCTNLNLSMRATLLYSMLGTFASMWL